MRSTMVPRMFKVSGSMLIDGKNQEVCSCWYFLVYLGVHLVVCSFLLVLGSLEWLCLFGIKMFQKALVCGVHSDCFFMLIFLGSFKFGSFELLGHGVF
jgi:hypothetical protein